MLQALKMLLSPSVTDDSVIRAVQGQELPSLAPEQWLLPGRWCSCVLQGWCAHRRGERLDGTCRKMRLWCWLSLRLERRSTVWLCDSTLHPPVSILPLRSFRRIVLFQKSCSANVNARMFVHMHLLLHIHVCVHMCRKSVLPAKSLWPAQQDFTCVSIFSKRHSEGKFSMWI